MELFDAEKGLFHFVFANGEDFYYTDSAIRLSLHQYIYCELIRREYKTVFFFAGDEGSYELSMVNMDFFGISEKKNGIFDRIKLFQKSGKALEDFAGKKIISGKNDFEDCLNRMITIMHEQDRIAFFFSIETFKELAEIDGIVEKLKELSAKNHKAGNRHLILIHAPISVGGSVDYLKDEKGIFRSGLFPEIDAIFSRKKNMYIYDELKNELDVRMIFLNTLTRDSVYNIVYRYFIKNEACLSNSFAIIDDYVDLIYFWHNSQAFREYAGKLFNDKAKRVFLNIEEGLEDKLVFNKITDCINTIKNTPEGSKSIKMWFFSNGYKLDNAEIPIVEHSSKITKLQQVYKRLQKKASDYYIKEDISTQLLQIIAKLQKPSVIIYDDYCSLSYLEKFIEFACEATSDKYQSVDLLTLEKSLKAIRYAIEKIFSITYGEDELSEEDYSNNQINDSCYELYMIILKSTVCLYTMQEENKLLNKRIAELENELERAIADEKSFEALNPDVVKRERQLSYGDKVSAEMHELYTKKERAYNLSETIKTKKLIKSQKSSWIEKLKATIQATETTLEMNFGENLKTINTSVEVMLRKAQDTIVNSKSLLQEISNSSDEFKDIINEAENIQSREIMPDLLEVNSKFKEVKKNTEISVEDEFEEVLQIYD